MLINRQLGPYLLVKRLAAGGMAEIFLALKRGPGTFEKLVVLKTIVSGKADNDLFRQMFAIEAEVAAWFNHPHVVQLHDVVELEGMDCMVMEFIPGHTLDEIVVATAAQNSTFPADLAVFLMIEVCEGLDYVHKLCHWDGSALGIVHRDVSPHNVMVTNDGHAKVFDFGIAYMGSSGHDELAGALVGKYAYMSPEQVRSEVIDARADVWSVGAMLWELTVGRRMFDDANELKLIRAITEEPIPLPSAHASRYPRFLERIVMQALEKDRDRRYASCAHLRDDLKKYIKISALKPDRAKVAAAIAGAFDDEQSAFKEMMRMVRSDMPSMDDTQSIDVRSLVNILGEDSALVLDEDEDTPLDPAYDADSEDETLNRGLDINQLTADRAAAAVVESKPVDVGPTSVPGDHDLTIDRPRPHMGLPPQPRRGLSIWAIVGFLLFGVFALGVGTAGAFVYFGGLEYYDIDLGAYSTLEPDKADDPAVPKPTAGSLGLASTPEGASIYLNGRLLSVVTPVTLPGIQFGEAMVVTIEKEGFEPAQENVTITEDEPEKTLELVLKEEASKTEGTGTIRVSTTPQDASIFIDNTQMALGTPVTLDGVPAGDELSLRVSREGYEDEIIAFSLAKGEIKDLEIELTEGAADAMGVLSIGSVPSNRKVAINGEYVGRTPIEGLKLPANTPLVLVVTDRALGTWRRRVVLKPGQVRRLRAAFGLVASKEEEPDAEEAAGNDPEKKAPAVLHVTSTPPTSVAVNGKRVGRSPVSDIKLPPGKYTLVFRDGAHNIEYSQTLTLVADETKNLQVTVPKGKLVLTSTPTSDVYVNKNLIGTTPIASHELYAGQHTVRMVAKGHGRAKEFRIWVKGSDTKRINETFKAIKVGNADKPKTPKDGKPDAGGGTGTTPQDGKGAADAGAVKTKDPAPVEPPPKTKKIEGEPYPLME